MINLPWACMLNPIMTYTNNESLYTGCNKKEGVTNAHSSEKVPKDYSLGTLDIVSRDKMSNQAIMKSRIGLA